MTDVEARKRGRPRAFFGSADSTIVQSVDKALRVLKAVSGRKGCSLSEVAEIADLPAATVYRSLITLQAHRIVRFDDDYQLWRIDVEAYRIGSAFLADTNLIEQAFPVMTRLKDTTGETANLGILSDNEVVFLTQVESHEPIRAFFRPGTRGAIHACGIGKALLSFKPESDAHDLLQKLDLTRFTAKTLCDPDALMEMRKTSLQQGYAVDDEERTPGMRCVAAPVFNGLGVSVSAVSVSGPTVRIEDDKIDHYGKLVREAADQISSNLGGRIPSF